MNMTPEELKDILEKHALWLQNNKNGKRANLSDADLSGADLSGADIDFASFKFACSFTNFKMNEAGVGQLLFHALNIAEHSGIDIKSIEDVYALVKQSTPITKHGLNLKAIEEKP